MVGRHIASDLVLILSNGVSKSMETDNALESKGAVLGGGDRGRKRFDSYSIRAGRDIKGYLFPLIHPAIEVQRYEDKITSQLNVREGIKAQLSNSLTFYCTVTCLIFCTDVSSKYRYNSCALLRLTVTEVG